MIGFTRRPGTCTRIGTHELGLEESGFHDLIWTPRRHRRVRHGRDSGAVLAKDANESFTQSTHTGLATTYRQQAILLSRQGLYAESEAYSREALRLEPNDIDALNELGAALWWQKRGAEAETIYRQADQLQPDDFRILTNLGLALYQQGRVDEAGDYYRRAIQIDLAAFDAHVNLGIVLSDQGKFDEANDWLMRARTTARLGRSDAEPWDEPLPHGKVA